MNRVAKKKLVIEYSRLFNDYESVFLMKNTGLSVSSSKTIRSHLRKTGSKFVIIKNSLAKIALKETKFLPLQDSFSGPIAVAFSNEPVPVSKSLIRFCEQGGGTEILAGMALNKHLDKNEVIALSRLPTENEIRGKIVNLVNSVSIKLVKVINRPGAKLASTIRAYVDKNKIL